MTTSKRSTAVIALATIGLVLALSSGAWACPGCKDALATGENGGDLVSGFFWSILFMLSMPFLIFGTFCTAMYIAVRRARAAQAAAGQSPQVAGAAATSVVAQRGSIPPGSAPQNSTVISPAG
jgi:hypothetical protein